METKEKNGYKPSVSWFLKKKSLLKFEGKNGEFYRARVFNGTTLVDGTNVSGYTYTFNAEKLKEIKAYDNSPDFIKDETFRNENGVIYYNEDTKIKLTEPYDKNNPDKELNSIVVEAKELSIALKNRQKSDRNNDGTEKSMEKGTKERVTGRAIAASKAKSDFKEEKEIEQDMAV